MSTFPLFLLLRLGPFLPLLSLPQEVGPRKSSQGVWTLGEQCKLPEQPQTTLNLVHFSIKM